MRYSRLFPKTSKSYPKDEVSINAKLLLKAGYIDKLMTGSYTLLTLGRRVEQKLENLIREEMNAIDAQEVLMPLLHSKTLWNESGRWESAKEVMYQFEKGGKEFALSFTHEEVVMDLIRKHTSSYKDFPIKIYHFSTKFRDEPRAKAGILRGREFLMKDLYSAHTTKNEMMDYYQKVSAAYLQLFKKIGLKVKVTEATGGVFTKEYTHEFQVLADGGEDTIYYCNNCDFAQNKEIYKEADDLICPKCKKGQIKSSRAIEVGNIFPLGTAYAEKMDVYFTPKDGGKKPVWLASYGIGVTRTLGALVEVFHDEKGIVWPDNVAPYRIHLLGLNLNNSTVKQKVEEVYKALIKKNIEVLYDDREDVAAGEKFTDADLIGIPNRLVVSEKTADKIEYKKRDKNETKLLFLDEVLKLI